MIDLSKVAEYYDKRARQYSESYQRCAWYSPDTQRQRFWAMTHHFDLERAIILDAGCGDGEFYNFVQTEFPEWRYVGIDISSEMITAARQRFPAGIFMHSELGSHGGDYDYVVASGTFNHHAIDPIGTLKQSLTTLYSLAQVALSVTLLSAATPVDARAELLYYYELRDILEIVQDITPYFDINHSYAKNDVCVTLFRR